MAVSYPTRSKVEKRQTWNAESVFKNHKAWEEEVRSILTGIEPLKKFKGRLGESPMVLLDAMAALEHDVSRRFVNLREPWTFLRESPFVARSRALARA